MHTADTAAVIAAQTNIPQRRFNIFTAFLIFQSIHSVEIGGKIIVVADGAFFKNRRIDSDAVGNGDTFLFISKSIVISRRQPADTRLFKKGMHTGKRSL